MKPHVDKLISALAHQGIFFLCANMVVMLCAVIIILSILVDFVKYHRPEESKKKSKSLVETGSMFLYFFVYCFLLKTEQGRVIIESVLSMKMVVVAGVLLVIAGCYVNVAGRMALRHNWANQVTIYKDQTLVTRSVYRFVRHPLYASLIWMFAGGCLIYTSYVALLSVVFIFIPMMFHRAKQEEKLLAGEFTEYSEYIEHTGMFFPKIRTHEKL
jgi:protein-S-isoprenylcysteine O-methyltransferase Ste14